MDQEEAIVMMQLTTLNGLIGMNGGGKGKEVARGSAKGSAKGKRRRRSGWQESNVIQWVHTNGQMQAFTAAIDSGGKKASGAGTESNSTTSISGLSGSAC
jgi:hypothetical protein